MQIDKKIELNVSIEKVWNILADEYHTIGKWARAVESSAENTEAASVNGSPVGGRVCKANIGDVTETITAFDPSTYHLSYTAKSKSMPFFVRGLKGDWLLKDNGSGTSVNLGFKADLMFPFSVLMGWILKRQFDKAITETLDDLKLYSETGKLHPDKLVALNAN